MKDTSYKEYMTYIADDKRYDNMKYYRCGESGLKLPGVSLGLWHNFGTKADPEKIKEMCHTAFDLGITHFDLANNYGPVPGSAEENFGKIINGDMKPYRDEMIISTKAGYEMWKGPYGNFGSRKYMLASLDQSLKRLGLEYVDIFYHHRMDPETPLEESMMALDSAVKQGKALYAGISNYDMKTTKKAMKILKELKCPFIINQVRYSIFDRWIEEDGLKNFAAENGCGLIAFSPLAQGMLSNRYLNGIPDDSRIRTDGKFLTEDALTEDKMLQIRELNKMAEERGQTLAQMALSWILKDQKIVSVIAGASNKEQIRSNVMAVNHTTFSKEEIEKIDKITNYK